MKTYEITCEISGPTAMWTRPDTGDTPVSCPAPSYGAVKAIFEIFAWSVRRSVIRTYRVDHIESVHSTKLSATIPENFDIATWLEPSFGIFQSGTGELKTIRIRFSGESARFVKESRWHHSLQLTLQKNGSLIAEFRLLDTQKIKPWRMSFGPSATVLEPVELMEQIHQDLAVMAEAYSSRSVN
jgi:predicted DNA-binding transcriptional regulator YafY